MKKTGLLFLCILLILTASGCSQSDKALQPEEYDIYENGALFIKVSEQPGIYDLNPDGKLGPIV